MRSVRQEDDCPMRALAASISRREDDIDVHVVTGCRGHSSTGGASSIGGSCGSKRWSGDSEGRRHGVGKVSKKPTAVDSHIGRRIRERRFTMKLRQDELADRLGISFQQLQKYEIGENRLAAARLFEIATALQVDVSWFFDGFAPQPTIGDPHVGSQEPAVAARTIRTRRTAN